METLAVSDVFFTVVHYFHHIDQDVQVAAMNAGQFLIPYIKSSLTRRSFILNDDNIKTLLHSFGKSMPVSSSLKLLHSFSLLQENCVTFVKKSIPLLSTSIMLLSPRVIEKELAFQLLWNMFHVHSGDQVKSTDSSGDSEVSVPAEYAVEDVLSELNIKLKRVLDDDLPSVQEWYTDLESLLKYLKRALSTCQQCEIQKLSSLMVQCVNKITRSKIILSLGYMHTSIYMI